MSEALHRLDSSLTLDTCEGRRLSSQLSSPLTCLSTLASFVNTSSASSSLIIHMVGSRKIEVSSLWSTLLSLSGNIEKISLIFIGLECIEPEESVSHDQRIEMLFVPPCSYDQYAASGDYQVSIILSSCLQRVNWLCFRNQILFVLSTAGSSSTPPGQHPSLTCWDLVELPWCSLSTINKTAPPTETWSPASSLTLGWSCVRMWDSMSSGNDHTIGYSNWKAAESP